MVSRKWDAFGIDSFIDSFIALVLVFRQSFSLKTLLLLRTIWIQLVPVVSERFSHVSTIFYTLFIYVGPASLQAKTLHG